MADKILRRPKVEKRTGHSRSTIYAKMDRNSQYYDSNFPKPVKLGKRAVGWYESRIEKYIENLDKESV